ncbi:MAG: Arm DNA-binding domain-containing protein, partial [Campylobacterota bacterium]|nr:Arm DNA-binding domain-containing protein [Campylobacterota bacterium]
MKTNLTESLVKRIKCEADKTKQEIYDKEIQGFILEVRANGAKTYYVRVKGVDGKRKSIRIGDAKIMTLKSARVKAIKLKRAIEEEKDIVLGKSSKTKDKAST